MEMFLSAPHSLSSSQRFFRSADDLEYTHKPPCYGVSPAVSLGMANHPHTLVSLQKGLEEASVLLIPERAPRFLPICPNLEFRSADGAMLVASAGKFLTIYVFVAGSPLDMLLNFWRKVIIPISDIAVNQKYQVIQILHILQDVDAVPQHITDPRNGPLNCPNYCRMVNLQNLPNLTHSHPLGVVEIKAHSLVWRERRYNKSSDFRIRYIQFVLVSELLHRHPCLSDSFRIILGAFQGSANSGLVNTQPFSDSGLVKAITPQKQDLPLPAGDRGNTSSEHITHHRPGLVKLLV